MYLCRSVESRTISRVYFCCLYQQVVDQNGQNKHIWHQPSHSGQDLTVTGFLKPCGAVFFFFFLLLSLVDVQLAQKLHQGQLHQVRLSFRLWKRASTLIREYKD